MSIVTSRDYKLAGKKRQRANVPQEPNRPETKWFMAINTANNPETDTSYFEWRPAPQHYTADPKNAAGFIYSYYAKRLLWPAVGANDHQRIGKKITGKLFRIKGFFTVMNNLTMPTRVRIYYFFYKSHNLTDQNVSHFKRYVNNIEFATTVDNTEQYGLWNFYDGMWKDGFMNTPDFFRTKIGDLYIKPAPVTDTSGNPFTTKVRNVTVPGPENSSVTTGYSWTFANVTNTAAYHIPFDKTVYLNQEICCDLDAHYLYFECDELANTADTNASNIVDTTSTAQIPDYAITPDKPQIVGQFKFFYYFQDG